MSKRKTSVIAGSLALLLAGSAFILPPNVAAQKKRQTVPPPKCETMSDADIVKTIADRIRRNKRFADQLDHISVTSQDHKVTLAGWVKGRPNIKVIAAYARVTGCAVENKLGASQFRVGCGSGLKDCFGSCIPINDPCESVGRSRN